MDSIFDDIDTRNLKNIRVNKHYWMKVYNSSIKNDDVDPGFACLKWNGFDVILDSNVDGYELVYKENK